jgi:hypothetical protein
MGQKMRFEMTTDGCLQAKQYLTDICKLEDFENNYTSVDGYSLVAYANYEFDKITRSLNKNRGCATGEKE